MYLAELGKRVLAIKSVNGSLAKTIKYRAPLITTN